jgi:hypothetical protein
MGFTPSLLKKRMTERCFSLVHVASGAAIFTLLLCCRVAFLHCTATCQPLFRPWVSLLSTYKTIELCFEFLSHFFKVFNWLSLVYQLQKFHTQALFLSLDEIMSKHHIQDSSTTRSPRRRCDFLFGKKGFGIDEGGNEVQKKQQH